MILDHQTLKALALLQDRWILSRIDVGRIEKIRSIVKFEPFDGSLLRVQGTHLAVQIRDLRSQGADRCAVLS